MDNKSANGTNAWCAVVELTRAERGGIMCEENLITVSRESVLRGPIGRELNSEM
jgi:hypothetical protein